MVNNEIFEGIKSSVNRGESLREAMMSFLNAGYKREEIEEAARLVQSHQVVQPVVQQASPTQNVKPIQIQKVSNYGTPPKQIKKEAPAPAPKVKSKISDYTPKPKKSGNWLIYLMVFILLVLIAGLVAVIFFKPELKDFFAGFYS